MPNSTPGVAQKSSMESTGILQVRTGTTSETTILTTLAGGDLADCRSRWNKDGGDVGESIKTNQDLDFLAGQEIGGKMHLTALQLGKRKSI